MHHKDLKPGDYFYSDTLKWQYLKMSPAEKRKHPDRYKAVRTDTGEICYITRMLIRKNK